MLVIMHHVKQRYSSIGRLATINIQINAHRLVYVGMMTPIYNKNNAAL